MTEPSMHQICPGNIMLLLLITFSAIQWYHVWLSKQIQNKHHIAYPWGSPLWVQGLSYVLTSQLPHCMQYCFNTLRSRQNGPYFTDNIFKNIFLNENVWILIVISLYPINNQATSHYLNQWWLSLLMHICITWPQWVKINEIDHALKRPDSSRQSFILTDIITLLQNPCCTGIYTRYEKGSLSAIKPPHKLLCSILNDIGSHSPFWWYHLHINTSQKWSMVQCLWVLDFLVNTNLYIFAHNINGFIMQSWSAFLNANLSNLQITTV